MLLIVHFSTQSRTDKKLQGEAKLQLILYQRKTLHDFYVPFENLRFKI
jgi:hypothetical protein